MGADRISVLTAEPSPLLLHQCGLAGIGGVLLDAEQTSLGVSGCADAVAILAPYATAVAVRVPDLAPATLVAFANTGVDELVLPQVRELAEIEAAWRAVHYAPEGERARQVTLASRFGTDYGHVPRLNMLVETEPAALAIESFAHSPLLAAVSVGANDLRDDLIRSRGSDAGLTELVDGVIAALRAAGRPVCLAAVDADGVATAFKRGATDVTVYWEKFLGGALRSFGAAA